MRKFTWVLLVGSAFGQNFYTFPQKLPKGSFVVCGVPAVGNPCSNQVNIFPDSTLTTPIQQPATIAADGNYGFWLNGSQAQITIQVQQPYNITYVASVGGGSGGGNISPGTANSQIPNWNPNASAYQPQPKAIFDSRDWTTCTGSGDNTIGFQNILIAAGSTPATIRLVRDAANTGNCMMSSFGFTKTTTLDFQGGGAFQTITSGTAPGGGAFDASGSNAAFNTNTSSCSVTVTPSTSGETYLVYTAFGFGGGTLLSGPPTSTNANDLILVSPSFQSNTNASMLTDLWIVNNVSSGTRTFTFNYTLSAWNSCHAVAVSGLGPIAVLDGNGGSTANCGGCTSSPMTATATFQSGSFLLAYGGQHVTTETCTATGGFTQPAGNAGQIGTSGTVCAMYINSSSAGSITANQTLSSTPTGAGWTYSVLGFRPGTATISILGGLNNPDNHQIFFNATGATGGIDFTGNLARFEVYPEWWGASAANANLTTNTAAIQAAIHGAFGTGRTNASGNSKYNKPLHFSGQFQVNGELQWYSVNNFVVNCDGRLKAGLVQTVTNSRIMDSQSMAYGSFHDCSWYGNANSTKPLLDIDFNGTNTPGDFAPQFLDFYNNTFVGNGQVDVGVLGAKSGGGAQFSNITFYDSAWQGFSGAGLQVGGNGIGRNVGRSYATNALAISIFNGDFQSCPLYGIATYGAGYIETHNTSFECVSPWASWLTSVLTSVDQYCEGPQGPCIMDHVRSEDLRLINSANVKVNDSQNTDQSTAFYSPVNCLAGGSEPLNWFIHPSDLGGDGALRQVTVHGTAFGGYCLFHVSGSTSTTVTDTDQTVAGAVTRGTPVFNELMTQAVSGSTGSLVVVPASIGTITGSVTTGTIGSGDTMTQATTGITCTSQNAPTGSQSLTCNNFSGTADSSHIWTDGTTGGTYTPSAAPAFSASNPSMLITAATGAPDNSHDWVGGTSGAHYTPTAVPVNEVNWGTNVFATSAPGQQQVTFWGATGAGNVCGPITANAATQITFTSCTSNFYGVHSLATDNTSAAIVEPFWSANPTQSGDFTWVKVNPEIIGGDNAQGSNETATCTINDVAAAGGFIQCGGNNGPLTYIRNLTVTRPDWYQNSANFSDATISQRLDGVRVTRPYSNSAGVGTGIIWSIPFRSANTNIFNGYPLSTQLGTSAFVTTAGVAGGGANANDVAYGMRSDPSAGTDAFRNRFEICSAWSGAACNGFSIGPPAPHGYNTTNQNGITAHYNGGSSSGNGVPGGSCLGTGSTAGSGSTINSGIDQWCVNSSGNLVAQATQSIIKGSVTFSNLPGSPVNGQEIYCSDCTVTTPASCTNVTNTAACTCAATGTGAMAKRINGAWLCN